MYVYIVVLNYQNYNDTIECLQSILLSDYESFRIVVVDNFSPNGSMQKLLDWADDESYFELPMWLEAEGRQVSKSLKRSRFLDANSPIKKINLDADERLIFIQSPSNGGFAAGNNIGLRFAVAQGDMQFAWILNNDTVIKSNAIGCLVSSIAKCLASGRKVGILGTKEYYYHNPAIPRMSYFKFNRFLAKVTTKISGEVVQYLDIGDNAPSGASMIVTEDFINEVGYLNEDYFLYFEELDWCYRARKYDYTLVILNGCHIYHKEGASIGTSQDSRKRSKVSDYYGIQNRLRFTKKYFSNYLPLVYLSLLIAFLNRIRRGQFDRIPILFRAIIGRR